MCLCLNQWGIQAATVKFGIFNPTKARLPNSTLKPHHLAPNLLLYGSSLLIELSELHIYTNSSPHSIN